MELLDTSPKKFYKLVMNKWLPLSNSLLQMVIEKLPSPKEAQIYRAPDLYTGPDDEMLRAMKECDPNGPVMMYVSKMVPLKQGDTRFYAFGRLFSGTIRAGQTLKIMGSNYEYGKKKDLHNGAPQQVVSLVASKADKMPDIPCGNTCALVGMDKFLMKTGTLSSNQDAYPIKDMKFSVSPIVQVAVRPKKVADLKKLMDALDKMKKTDPIVQVTHLDTGEIIVAGPGELHLEICIQDLRDYMGGTGIEVDPPIVPYRETVTVDSGTWLTKSPNKHNRLYCTAEPIPSDLCVEVDEGTFVPRPKDEKEQLAHVHSEYGLDKDLYSTKKLWSFGPTDEDANFIINDTSGAQYMDEIKSGCVGGFVWATREGPLCGEPMRGVQIKIKDVTLHADSIHRGMGQIMPCMRRIVMGCLLKGKPRLVEPIFLTTITVPQDNSGGVYGVVTSRRGTVLNNEVSPENRMCSITAYLPVAGSFGFDSSLKEATSGNGFAQCSFSHWEIVKSDPLEEGTYANKIMKEIRKRKGLTPMKSADHYLDKL
jgi:elongation factor 2